MINILCTSKPGDGLLYYSYETCHNLNEKGIKSRVIIITHPGFVKEDYIDAITKKYIHCNNVLCDEGDLQNENDITLIMGRSMMTLPFLDYYRYSQIQQFLLFVFFSGNVISVYSENHIEDYPKAVEYFNPWQIKDLCDYEVYPNGVGDNFQKTIDFSIYKKPIENIVADTLFIGTNQTYYNAAKKYLNEYSDYAILTYKDAKFLDPNLNHIFAPTENLIGKFNKYIYTKETLDPAPRLTKEFEFFGKEVIYKTSNADIYKNRKDVKPDVQPILDIMETFE